MSIPQLTGSNAVGRQSAGTSILLAVCVLALVLALIGWRLLSRTRADVSPAPSVAANVNVGQFTNSEDERLHLDHAERMLVTAAEQLTAARRTLANLSPSLSRSYLEHERRRSDAAWTACDSAARAIEQARDDLKVVVEKRKD